MGVPLVTSPTGCSGWGLVAAWRGDGHSTHLDLGSTGRLQRCVQEAGRAGPCEKEPRCWAGHGAGGGRRMAQGRRVWVQARLGESPILRAEGRLGAACLQHRLWGSCLLILLHLADSCLPEAGKVAEVPTGPEIVLRSLSRSRPATGQGGPAGALSHSQIRLCALVSQDCPPSAGGAQASLLLGPLPGASMKCTRCHLL